MSRLTDLLNKARQSDPALAADLEREIKHLTERRAFGLNFERHTPETVELPGRRVRRGDKVRILPPRGEARKAEHDTLWRVTAITKDGDARVAELDLLVGDGSESASVDDLIVVAEFRDPIYPGLVSTGKVERGGDKPFHTVINAENYHALQTLLFTHRGKIDAIYIDPPYNTGAKDWKYNNDYVDGEDHYRHSKWLAFMERRLLVAKELLNPNDSVLIVTIDEKEVHRLGLLLEQIFPESRAQMVSIVIQNAGSSRKSELGRVEEYAFFLFFGAALPEAVRDDLLNPAPSTKAEKVRWESLLRSGTGSARADSPQLFFPVFVNSQSGQIAGCGDSKPVTAPRDSWPVPEGAHAVWPIKKNGSDGRWRCSPDTLRGLVADGYARAGDTDAVTGKGTIWYLGRAARKKIESGEFRVTAADEQGAAIVEVVNPVEKTFPAKTVWNRQRHHAGWHGTNLLSVFLPDRKFPFPKSLYAVEDSVRLAVLRKPTATVLDFFSGSGTTAHAVMRLNKQDGGRRQCISVTNNEVSAEEQKRLRKMDLRPGDPEWETLGICDYVTKPRIRAAITGKTPAGEVINGDYKFIDEFPISNGFEENAEFFTLTYESPGRVARNRDFARIAPLLWMAAGSVGRRIDDVADGWDVADSYGVLVDLDQSEDFVHAVVEADNVSHAFIVTDDERSFQAIADALPDRVECVRLYEAYLKNFEIQTARSAQ